jgi:TonB family protein
LESSIFFNLWFWFDSRSVLRGLRAADHQEAVERAKMKRILVLISALVLGLSSLGFAADQISGPTDKVVIDRTTANRTLNNYVMWTRDSIQKVWTTPINLMTSDALKGKIAVMYEVERDGSLVSLQLLRGSGNSDLDRSLLGAIRAASPFPAFPGEITANRVLIKANFIVADLPVVPVLRVEHRAGAQGPSEPQQIESHKKYIWGVPAGTALRKDLSIPRDENLKEKPRPTAAFPHSMKFQWGVNGNQ